MRPDEETMNAVDLLFDRPDLPDDAVSPWRLERYLSDDLSAQDRAAVAQALRQDPALAARLAALEAEDAAFEAAHPWSAVRAELQTRAARVQPLPAQRAPWRRWFAVIVPLAAALALAIMWPGEDPARSPNRLKGGGMSAMQLVEGVAQPLSAGDSLAPGARLQLRISTAHPWLVLLGVDGTGTVSRYAPVGGELSAAILPGQGVPLADSFVLDASPGPEVFVALLSPEALLVEDLEQALHDRVQDHGPRALLDVGALDGIAPQVAVFWVEKDVP